MTYKPTGQKIYFRGLDDPLKVTSITVETGCLCWMWIEEAYEISSEDDFNMLDESIRGAVPEGSGLFKQVTLTLNPWNEHHWIKKRFFDKPDEETLAMTTNYLFATSSIAFMACPELYPSAGAPFMAIDWNKLK